ncbi:hypothetical protein [Streptomyces sp. NPDC005438]|uniref:hypothetical protein n=1 Tax=Streptomyces sp. NPDC005438 TaxID=3156880 RepID=UPI0033B0E063
MKQFYSPECKQNWSYVWVWKSYHDTGAHYDLRTSVYSYTKDAFYGSKSWKSTRQQEFWSGATNTASHCTAGVGGLRQLGDPVTPEAASSKRC